MKPILIRRLLLMLKLLTGSVMIQAVCFNMLLAADRDGEAQQALSAKEVFISIDLKHASLTEVFKEIEAKTDFRFSYEKKDLDKRIQMNLKSSKQSVADILLQVSRLAHLKFKQVNNSINVSKMTGQASPRYEVELKPAITVTGMVTSQSDGQGLPGVNVLVKNTTIGTVTDIEGHYSINAPDEDNILVFSSIGYATQEVAVNGRTTIDLAMAEDVQSLEEVVVTALGIERQAKKLGYATTTVETEQLLSNPTTNVGNSLVGKVAGLSVAAPPTGPGGSSKIRIRGQSSFGGDNSPLIIVNGVPINNAAGGAANRANKGYAGEARTDTGDGLQSINPNNIESMTVLKGAAAAALYGFRAKDGAIIITTKTGRNQQGIGVEFNSTFRADQPLDFTDFQYIYGQGEDGFPVQSVADARRTGTWSFGPKFDGEPMWQVDGTQRPYLPFKDRIKAFYDIGKTFTNSIALSGGNDNGNFRLSFANTDAGGIIPNVEFNKKILNLGLNYNFSEKLSTQVNANYSIEDNQNPPVVSQEAFNVNQVIFTMSNSIDPRWLQNVYKDPVTGNEIGISRFTPRTNPYWSMNERFENHKRDRLFGNVSLRYQFTPWLWVQGRVSQDYFSSTHHVNRPTGTASLGPAPSGFNGNFYQDTENFREVDLDFLIGANQEFGVFGVDVTLGGNAMDQKSERLFTSVTNFYIRDLYTIGNGQIKDPGYTYYRKAVNSLFATVDFSLRDYLFLNITGRNDWFSTLNPESNSYLYPSASTSFVFSEALDMPEWLNFGKLRVAYAEVGGDTDPYSGALFYSMNSNQFNGVAFGNIAGSTSPNPNLRPLKVREVEAGFQLRLFTSRINLDFAVYKKNTEDEILDVDISNASGYGQTKVNVGRLRNQGVELLLSLVPVVTENFNWESTFNFTYNQSEVLELANNQERVDVGTGNFIGIVSHEVGKPLASLRGVDYKRDEQGRVITADGRFLAGDIITYGSGIPTHIGGWLNTFTYKGFRVFAQVDFKAGHKLISNSNFNFMRHGLHKGSLVGREGGVVFEGVNEDGTPNTTAVGAEAFYSDYRSKDLTTPFVYDASFVRWRSLSVGYDLSRFVNNTFIKGLNINAFVNNVLLIKKHVPNIDPESQYSASDLLTGIQGLSVPNTRSYGLDLNIKF